ncbi:MAG TPA: hypothetical protein DDW49_07070 [Deltaproteobacteria bacterium]|nr:MAG: hypothetical protein A2048_10210 [Deltaproteobacteria bacterium GWA2_45_12]HBF13132.1 hypothetical protein [Deltaproteobacteria bacterium]
MVKKIKGGKGSPPAGGGKALPIGPVAEALSGPVASDPQDLFIGALPGLPLTSPILDRALAARLGAEVGGVQPAQGPKLKIKPEEKVFFEAYSRVVDSDAVSMTLVGSMRAIPREFLVSTLLQKTPTRAFKVYEEGKSGRTLRAEIKFLSYGHVVVFYPRPNEAKWREFESMVSSSCQQTGLDVKPWEENGNYYVKHVHRRHVEGIVGQVFDQFAPHLKYRAVTIADNLIRETFLEAHCQDLDIPMLTLGLILLHLAGTPDFLAKLPEPLGESLTHFPDEHTGRFRKSSLTHRLLYRMGEVVIPENFKRAMDDPMHYLQADWDAEGEAMREYIPDEVSWRPRAAAENFLAFAVPPPEVVVTEEDKREARLYTVLDVLFATPYSAAAVKAAAMKRADVLQDLDLSPSTVADLLDEQKRSAWIEARVTRLKVMAPSTIAHLVKHIDALTQSTQITVNSFIADHVPDDFFKRQELVDLMVRELVSPEQRDQESNEFLMRHASGFLMDDPYFIQAMINCGLFSGNVTSVRADRENLIQIFVDKHKTDTPTEFKACLAELANIREVGRRWPEEVLNKYIPTNFPDRAAILAEFRRSIVSPRPAGTPNSTQEVNPKSVLVHALGTMIGTRGLFASFREHGVDVAFDRRQSSTVLSFNMAMVAGYVAGHLIKTKSDEQIRHLLSHPEELESDVRACGFWNFFQNHFQSDLPLAVERELASHGLEVEPNLPLFRMSSPLWPESDFDGVSEAADFPEEDEAIEIIDGGEVSRWTDEEQTVGEDGEEVEVVDLGSLEDLELPHLVADKTPPPIPERENLTRLYIDQFKANKQEAKGGLYFSLFEKLGRLRRIQQQATLMVAHGEPWIQNIPWQEQRRIYENAALDSMKNGNWKEAFQWLAMAYQLAQKNRAVLEMVRASIFQQEVLSRDGQEARSHELVSILDDTLASLAADRSETAPQSYDDLLAIGDIYFQMQSNFKRMGQALQDDGLFYFWKASTVYAQAAQLADTLKDNPKKIRAMKRQIKALEEAAKFDEMIMVYKQLAEYYVAGKQSQLAARTYKDAALAAELEGTKRDAAKLIGEALRIEQRLGLPEGEAISRRKLADFKREESPVYAAEEYVRAAKCFERAEREDLQMECLWQAWQLFNESNKADRKESVKESLKPLLDAHKESLSNLSPNREVEEFSKLTEIYFHLGFVDEAEDALHCTLNALRLATLKPRNLDQILVSILPVAKQFRQGGFAFEAATFAEESLHGSEQTQFLDIVSRVESGELPLNVLADMWMQQMVMGLSRWMPEAKFVVASLLSDRREMISDLYDQVVPQMQQRQQGDLGLQVYEFEVDTSHLSVEGQQKFDLLKSLFAQIEKSLGTRVQLVQEAGSKTIFRFISLSFVNAAWKVLNEKHSDFFVYGCNAVGRELAQLLRLTRAHPVGLPCKDKFLGNAPYDGEIPPILFAWHHLYEASKHVLVATSLHEEAYDLDHAWDRLFANGDFTPGVLAAREILFDLQEIQDHEVLDVFRRSWVPLHLEYIVGVDRLFELANTDPVMASSLEGQTREVQDGLAIKWAMDQRRDLFISRKWDELETNLNTAGMGLAQATPEQLKAYASFIRRYLSEIKKINMAQRLTPVETYLSDLLSQVIELIPPNEGPSGLEPPEPVRATQVAAPEAGAPLVGSGGKTSSMAFLASLPLLEPLSLGAQALAENTVAETPKKPHALSKYAVRSARPVLGARSMRGYSLRAPHFTPHTWRAMPRLFAKP